MTVVEQIGDLGIETSQELELHGLEDMVTAYAAISETFGEDHPLLLPGDRTYGTSLWDKLQEAGSTESEQLFTGKVRRLIVVALTTIADKESGSLHQQNAARMLGQSDEEFTNPFDSLPIALKTEQSKPTPNRVSTVSIPRRSRKRRFGQQLALCSFAEVVAAKRAVEEFEGKDSVLLRRGHGGRMRRSNLVDAVDTIGMIDSKNPPEPYVFYGSKARVVQQALLKAAARNETVYDKAAALVLKDKMQVRTPTRALSERLPAERRARLAGSMAMQR